MNPGDDVVVARHRGTLASEDDIGERRAAVPIGHARHAVDRVADDDAVAPRLDADAVAAANPQHVVDDLDPVEAAVVGERADPVAEEDALHASLDPVAADDHVRRGRQARSGPGLYAVGMVTVPDHPAGRRIIGGEGRVEVRAAIALDGDPLRRGDVEPIRDEVGKGVVGDRDVLARRDADPRLRLGDAHRMNLDAGREAHVDADAAVDIGSDDRSALDRQVLDVDDRQLREGRVSSKHANGPRVGFLRQRDRAVIARGKHQCLTALGSVEPSDEVERRRLRDDGCDGEKRRAKQT